MTQPDFTPRLADLRAQLSANGYDGFLVPMADEYQSEYVPPCAQRIGFLSGFTGSSAFIVVLKDKAAFFTDSRYTLQAAQQVPGDLFRIFDMAEESPSAWLEENIGKDSKIAYDPWLHTTDSVERLQKVLAKKDAYLVAARHNLVDMTWVDRPAAPTEPVYPHDIAYAGKSAADKRHDIAESLKKRGVAAFIVADPTSVAWLLNVRGNDVANTPLPLSRGIIHDDGSAQWFLDKAKISDGLQAHIGEQVVLRDPEEFPTALAQLGRSGKGVLIDATQTASAIVDYLRAANAKIELGDDPCELPRAVKNPVELDGIRAAHRRDGAALVRFLSWLDQSVGRETLTEMDVEHRLAQFREANNNYRGPSFDTIAGAGEHGAIVHYRSTSASNALLKPGSLFLLDSGGQYLDGTTDVTRTVAIGEPTPEMRDRFTRVLKGHIALASIRFPEGTAGGALDVLARQFLWQAGVDYGHGTGHGVGAYLGVHEGPQAISMRSKVPLQPGMVVSNEPGYYKAGHYGIRIENLQTIVPVVGPPGSEKPMLGFETLTLAPIDRRLVDATLMNDDEINWLNAYHARILQVLRPMLDEVTVIWLEAATLPINK